MATAQVLLPGQKWYALTAGAPPGIDVIKYCVDTYKNDEPELASMYNFLYTRRSTYSKTIRKSSWATMQATNKSWVHGVVMGTYEPMILWLNEVEPPPETRAEGGLNPRGIQYQSDTLIVNHNSLNCNAPNWTKRDSFGNKRTTPFGLEKTEAYSLSQLEKLKARAINSRNRFGRWLFGMGFAKDTIEEIQQSKHLCPIWLN